MKRYFFILVFIALVFSASAQNVWTVSTVPNTRLQGNDIHVSDPDGFLSDSVEMQINMALCAIRDTADVFVVTLASIDSDDPKHFATGLFNYWGIGDAETDNGVLLLFVEDQHALEFETGYGAEETLTDAMCQRIFTKAILPFFREGDYEDGLCAGVAAIVEVYSGEIPMELESTLLEDDNASSGEDDEVSVIFGLFALIVFVMPWVGIYYWSQRRAEGKQAASDAYNMTKEGGITYIDGLKTNWSGSPWEGKGCLVGMMLGLSIFVFLFIVITVVVVAFPNFKGDGYYNWVSIVTLFLYLTWICFRQNHRALAMADKLAKQSVDPKSVYKAAFNNSGNKIATWIAPWLGWLYYLAFKKKIEQTKDCQCPMCNARMKKDSRFVLPEIHAAEQKVEAWKFRPFRCSNGHLVVVKERGKLFSHFKTCAKCGAFTLKMTKSETLVMADYSHSGERKDTYVCQHCGDVIEKTVVIPKRVHYTTTSSSGSRYSSSSSSGRSYSSHSSSHSSSRSSSGSFGGGHSGGGGFSGRW